MIATEKYTIASVRKLARLRWGKMAEIIINPKALDAASKAAEKDRRAEMKAEQEAIKVEQRELGNTTRLLREAARFAVDVDAQEPSFSQLRAALERDERSESLSERWKELAEELQKSGLYSHRYEVVTVERRGPFPHMMQHAYADTLEELAEKIKNESKNNP